MNMYEDMDASTLASWLKEYATNMWASSEGEAYSMRIAIAKDHGTKIHQIPELEKLLFEAADRLRDMYNLQLATTKFSTEASP